MKNLRSRGALRELISYWEHWNNKFSSLLMDSEKKIIVHNILFLISCKTGTKIKMWEI